MTLRCTISWLLSWHHVTNNNGITLKIRELSHLLPLQSRRVDVFQSCCRNCESGCVDFRSSYFLFLIFVSIDSSIFFAVNFLKGLWCQWEAAQLLFHTYRCLFLSWCRHSITQSDAWPTATNSIKKKENGALQPTLSFAPVSQHNTWNNWGWHPPLIPWSFLLSHMSKTLETCYPLSHGRRNQRASHF